MKSLSPVVLWIAAMLLILAGCKSINLNHCPDLTRARKSLSLSTLALHFKSHHITGSAKTSRLSLAPGSLGYLATLDEMPAFIVLPNIIARNLNEENDLHLRNQSVLNEAQLKGIQHLRDRRKPDDRNYHLQDSAVVNRERNQFKNAYEKRFGPDPGDGSREAYISKVLGAFGLVSLIVPIFAPISLALAIAAILMARRGLDSENRKSALTGLRLGIATLAILFAVAILLVIIFLVVI